MKWKHFEPGDLVKGPLHDGPYCVISDIAGKVFAIAKNDVLETKRKWFHRTKGVAPLAAVCRKLAEERQVNKALMRTEFEATQAKEEAEDCLDVAIEIIGKLRLGDKFGGNMFDECAIMAELRQEAERRKSDERMEEIEEDLKNNPESSKIMNSMLTQVEDKVDSVHPGLPDQETHDGPILKKEFGGHDYPGRRDPKWHRRSECEFGCKCWMASSSSWGPDGIDPFGECPNNPVNGEDIPF